MAQDKKQQKPTEINPDSGLTILQEKAALLLASGESITSVSEELGLNRSTIYEWQKKITFQCFINSIRKEHQEATINRILQLHKKALEALENCMASDNDLIRFKAATWIIEKANEISVSSSDAREILKEEATTIKNPMEWNTKEVYFDEAKYKKLLKENGLKEG